MPYIIVDNFYAYVISVNRINTHDFRNVSQLNFESKLVTV